MKKIVIVICTCLLLIGCTSKIIKEKNKLDFSETDEFKNLLENKNNIKSFIITELTDGGRFCYDANSVINDAFELFDNIKEITETNIEVTDDDTIYEFILNDGTSIHFSFNGRSYVFGDKKYEVGNFYKISVRDLEEIGCE